MDYEGYSGLCRAGYRFKSDYVFIVLRLLIMVNHGVNQLGIPAKQVRENTPCC